MNYTSTRSNQTVSASQAILQGLSQEGGLFVPQSIIPLDLSSMMNDSYQTIAFKLLSLYFTNIPADDLKSAIFSAYSDHNFRTENITEIKTFNNTSFLELFHGRTCAFKDMALSLFPYLVQASIQVQNKKEHIFILTATSGDTGKAAMEALSNQPGISIAVLYPQQGVSRLQKRQMQTQEGDNVFVLSIDGNFDDAQRAVKKAFASSDFIESLEENHYELSSANSINIARFLPQCVYYIDLYLRLVRENTISMGAFIDVSVPTGNFGNILAAHFARKMGVPIRHLICASNENNILADFIQQGIFNLENRPFHKTYSPSMDILVPSNLERYLYTLNPDIEQIQTWMNQLQTRQQFSLDEASFTQLKKELKGHYTSNQETLDAIQSVYSTHHYLMDPHTAVAYDALVKSLDKESDVVHQVVISTASPFKFVDTYRSLFTLPEDDFDAIRSLSDQCQIEIPKSLLDLEHQPIRFSENSSIQNIEQRLKKFAKESI